MLEDRLHMRPGEGIIFDHLEGFAVEILRIIVQGKLDNLSLGADHGDLELEPHSLEHLLRRGRYRLSKEQATRSIRVDKKLQNRLDKELLMRLIQRRHHLMM